MSIVRASLRRPATVAVLVLAVALGAIVSIARMPRDILPNLGIPVIYVAQPYGGMSPAQMEGYLTYYYEYHFLYLTGIEHVESKSIQGISLIKLQFHPGTNMAQAMAETINYANRARAFMPPGTVPPFVMRFDAGSVPIGNLVFSSSSHTVGELQDLALNRVRPLFATLPGVSAPPPFGASQRSMVIRVNPDKLREYNLSPENVAEAVATANVVSPAGNIHLGTLYPMVTMNAVVQNIKELENVPLRPGTKPTVFLRDVATIQDSTDLPTGFALVNGQRTVYIPVTKRADASTLAVVDEVRKNLPKFQAVLPQDVKVSYEFDQSVHVRIAIRSLLVESLLGTLLTGLMVLIFLRNLRSALLVVATIPLALFGSTVALALTDQTVNIMTLGGLALAVGILVDEAIVTIENIHTHRTYGKSLARACLDATEETVLPRFLSMLCVLAVFLPSFIMTGAPRALFVPLSLAVGFAMVSSYLLSSTLVPIASLRLLRKQTNHTNSENPTLTRIPRLYGKVVESLISGRVALLLLYLTLTATMLFFASRRVGTEIFPQTRTGQLQIRLRTPTGTAIEYTETAALHVLDIIKQDIGPQNVDVSVGFVGVQPPNFPINSIYLWTSGPNEAVLQVAFRSGSKVNVAALKERLRVQCPQEIPNLRLSFEPSDIVSRVMSQGSPTPIQVAVAGPNFSEVQKFSERVYGALAKIPALRDIQCEQGLDYPAVQIAVDREKAGVMGLTVANVGRALTDATSSSRYILPNYWSDPKSGIAYQIQVEVPQERMTSVDAVKNISVPLNAGAIPIHRFAEVNSKTVVGEYDRYNMQRMITVTANIEGKSMGDTANQVSKALKELDPDRPTGVSVTLRGQITPMQQMFDGLKTGLALAIVVIFLLLAANFQSFKISLAILSSSLAVLAGVGISLWLTHTTLNVESFMGTIMALGVAVANAVLLVSFAQRFHQQGANTADAMVQAAQSRLRPILMTSGAMLVGMMPMALGLGEGAEQVAPLGRAVVGGLAAATLTTLFVLPAVYVLFRGPMPYRSASMDPGDKESAHFETGGITSTETGGTP